MVGPKKKTPARKPTKPAVQKTSKPSSAAQKAVRTGAKAVVTAKAKPGKTVAKKVAASSKTASAKKKVPAKAGKKTAVPLKAKRPAVAGKKALKPAKTAARKQGKKAPEKRKPAVITKVSAPAPVADRFHELKKMLLTKRNGILQEAKQEIAKYVSGENRQLVDTAIDEGDWATVDISEDISFRRLSAQRHLLQDIEECLRKIQEGTYGICEECGEEISAKRLSVIPMATLCLDCKENKERMSAMEYEAEM